MGLRSTQAQPPLEQFDQARKRLNQQFTSQDQSQKEALQRRFASQGALNSGTAIKAEQIQSEQLGQQRTMAEEGINAQEAEERRRLNEVQQQREFQSTEAEKQRSFGAGEAEKAREFEKGNIANQQSFASRQAEIERGFGAGEAEKAREFEKGNIANQQSFASRQAEIERGFGAGEAEKGRQFTKDQAAIEMNFKKQLADYDQYVKNKQLELGDKEFGLKQDEQNFNKMISIIDIPDAGGRIEGLRAFVDDPATNPGMKQAALRFLSGYNGLRDTDYRALNGFDRAPQAAPITGSSGSKFEGQFEQEGDYYRDPVYGWQKKGYRLNL